MIGKLKIWSAASALLLLLGFVHLSATAQSSRGELAGSVTDTTGAVIPGATITAVNQGTGGKNVAQSSSSGSYRFPDLPIGVYTVTVTAASFGTSNNTGVQVTINSTTALNVVLKTGAVSDVVSVDASGLSLESESSDISGTVSNKQIEDLPLSLLAGVAAFVRRRPLSSSFPVRLVQAAAPPATPATVSSSPD